LKIVYQSLFLKLDPTRWICFTLDKSAMAISLGEIRTYGPFRSRQRYCLKSFVYVEYIKLTVSPVQWVNILWPIPAQDMIFQNKIRPRGVKRAWYFS
jgi:hypothetical protein